MLIHVVLVNSEDVSIGVFIFLFVIGVVELNAECGLLGGFTKVVSYVEHCTLLVISSKELNIVSRAFNAIALSCRSLSGDCSVNVRCIAQLNLEVRYTLSRHLCFYKKLTRLVGLS